MKDGIACALSPHRHFCSPLACSRRSCQMTLSLSNGPIWLLGAGRREAAVTEEALELAPLSRRLAPGTLKRPQTVSGARAGLLGGGSSLLPMLAAWPAGPHQLGDSELDDFELDDFKLECFRAQTLAHALAHVRTTRTQDSLVPDPTWRTFGASQLARLETGSVPARADLPDWLGAGVLSWSRC